MCGRRSSSLFSVRCCSSAWSLSMPSLTRAGIYPITVINGASVAVWEGSAQRVAYSEFNHHLAGLLVLLMGCAELSQALHLTSLLWARLMLPAAMLLGSVILLVGSDHEAWPIGSLSFAQTFSGHDPEIIQHKIYALLLFLVGTVEAVRRTRRI